MKKLLLSIAFVGAFAFTAKSQGIYFNGGLNYGFRAGSSIAGTNYNSDGSSERVKGSLGAGIVPSLGVGYFFNENVGAELNFGYLIGRNFKTEDKFNYSDYTNKYKANSFFVNPQIVVKASGDSKIVPYAKFGIFLGLSNSATLENHYVNKSNTTTYDEVYKYKGGMSTGITSSFGVDYKLSDNLIVFGELAGRAASWSPKSYTQTETTITTSGSVSTRVDKSSSGNYVKSLPANYTGSDTYTTPRVLSSLGINIGVRFCLF